MTTKRMICTAALLGALTSQAHAGVGWNEAVDGDLSNVATSPTAVTVAAGANQILGTTGNQGSGTDRDLFKVSIPVGLQLSSISVLTGTAPLGLGFFGVQAGTQISSFSSAAALLGWYHYSAADIGSNILPLVGQGAGALGFTGPLPAGTYTFWIQDFNAGTSTYAFQLDLAAVPEPATGALLLGGLAVLVGLRQRPAR